MLGLWLAERVYSV